MKTGKNYPYTQAHRHSASDTVLWRPAYGAVCVCRLAKYQKKNCITCFNVGKLVLAEIKREQDKPNAMKIKNEHSRAFTQTHAHTQRENNADSKWNRAKHNQIQYNKTSESKRENEKSSHRHRRHRFLRSFKATCSRLVVYISFDECECVCSVCIGVSKCLPNGWISRGWNYTQTNHHHVISKLQSLTNSVASSV